MWQTHTYTRTTHSTTTHKHTHSPAKCFYQWFCSSTSYHATQHHLHFGSFSPGMALANPARSKPIMNTKSMVRAEARVGVGGSYLNQLGLETATLLANPPCV